MRVYDYPAEKPELMAKFAKAEQRDNSVDAIVANIINEVRTHGDDAVFDFIEKFDKVRLTPETVKADPTVCAAAWEKLDPALRDALVYAANGIREFHARQLPESFTLTRPNGTRLTQRIRPLRRVGVYVPGGRATYPSTVLMNVIPAQVAGVKDIVMVTPPVHGDPTCFTPFACAHMLGIADNVYTVGGAQAVAALAFGTKTLERVDKVVGPGNAFVACAKRMLYGIIDIDSVAGESEVLIIADKTANPAFIASDLFAQAEHTGNETVVLLGIGADFDFEAIEKQIAAQIATAPRRAQIESTLSKNSFFVRVPDAETAIEVANAKAPEHLEILAENDAAIAEKIDAVGAIFLGPWTPEPVGDYVAGPNHVLPTGGTARFFSPLGVDSFLKRSNVLCYNENSFAEAAPHTIALAANEGLFAHANAVKIRQK